MGLAATNAANWLHKREADIPTPERQFIALSLKAARTRRRRLGALIGVLALAIVTALSAWMQERITRCAVALVHGHAPLYERARAALCPQRRRRAGT